MDDLTQSLIRRLAAGEAVAAEPVLLGVLETLGLEALAEDGEVRLNAPLELLDANRIGAGLSQSCQDRLSQLEIFWSIGSTNTYLMQQADAPGFCGRVCLAEQQREGKGRRGRHWVSPFATNIALSLGWEVPRRVAGVGGLSLVVGMAVVAALRNCGLHGVGLKWPNDVLLDGGKLCGILVEMAPLKDGQYRMVIGIGVNLAMSRQAATGIDQAFSTAGAALQAGRNQLIAEILEAVVSELSGFEAEGFSGYAARWPEFDLYKDQWVDIRMADAVQQGINRGVDAEGNLLLETGSGIKGYNAGEVSLRPTKT